jgi:hypothetical protein
VRGLKWLKTKLSLVKVCLLAKSPYVAGPHPRANKFVPRHFSDGFGQLPFVYGDPLANQLDGFFLIGFVRKEIPHDSGLSLGIETRDPDVLSCCHSWHYAPELSWVNGWQLVTVPLWSAHPGGTSDAPASFPRDVLHALHPMQQPPMQQRSSRAL